jgi:hypothetical protein
MNIDRDQWNRTARRITVDSQNVAKVAVQKAIKAALVKAKEGRFKDQTGKLRSEIRMDLEGWNGSFFWGFVTSPTKYAKFVEFPTVPHDIYPKAAYGMIGPTRAGQTRRAFGKGPHEYIVGRGLALRWKDADGEVHFAKMVHHPGTEGKKYMWGASIVALTTLRIALRDGFAMLSTTH